MVQLRYNNALGAIEALDDSSTTITFTVAPPFATLSGDEYIALTLDPPSLPSPSTSFERVYLTAYIEGETTGTIARGQEGTTPVAHSSSAVWMDAPSAADYSNAAMSLPVAAKAYCNADQSASGVWTKILLDTLDFDTASNMDVTTNHCFVCPETGYYEASGSVGSDIGANNYAAIYKNGEAVVYGGSGGGRGTISSGAFFCNAGDHIELWGIASAGSLNNAEGAAMNYLSVSQVQGGVGNSSILLDFTQVTDISGLSIPEDTWTAIPATQHFTVVDGSVPIQICLSGCVQMYNGDNCGARVNIDSGAKTFLIGGYPGANSNVLAGAGTRVIPGGTLSAGVHSLDLEVYVLGSSSGSVYCRAASFPEIEGLTIQVVEF